MNSTVLKSKFLNAALVVSSLFGYLEWGEGGHSFLFQAESDIFRKVFSDPASILHPFILLPMAGQILLLATLLQKAPGKRLTIAGISCLALLLVFIFAIGLMSMRYKIILGALPFLVLAVVTILHHWNNRINHSTIEKHGQ